jgi:hypothetical protein
MTTVLFAAAGLPSFLRGFNWPLRCVQVLVRVLSYLFAHLDALFFKGRLFLPCHSVLIYFSLLFRYLIPIYIYILHITYIYILIILYIFRLIFITNKSVILHYYNFKSIIIILYLCILYPRYDFYQ